MSSFFSTVTELLNTCHSTILSSYSKPRGTTQQLAVLDTISCICTAFYTLGAFTMISGLAFGIHAQYGRFSSLNKSIKVPGKIAWILQEFPSFGVASYFLWRSQEETFETVPIGNRLLLVLFTVHYVNRTFIFPLRLRGGKSTPLLEFVMAALFTTFNGLLQGLCLTQYDEYKGTKMYDLSYMAGIALFICGFSINLHSDSVLRNLRKPGETGYKIPYGGLFEFVTAANYFGELMEWMGFAIAGNNAGGYCFAIFTFSNLFPRAYHTHRWYHDKFKGEYPRDRKIMIPFLL